MAKPHAKDQLMQEHITAWQNSGLTQTEYCKGSGLKRDNFNYYKKKFLLRKSPVKQNHQLVPVKLLEDTTQFSQTIKISHRNGFSLDINPRDELCHLEALLKLLSQV